MKLQAHKEQELPGRDIPLYKGGNVILDYMMPMPLSYDTQNPDLVFSIPGTSECRERVNGCGSSRHENRNEGF
jgi:hypothetical protein